MIVTWRLLRTPAGDQRRQPKRPAREVGSGVNTHSNAPILDPSSVSSSSGDFRAQHAIDGFFQPVKV